MSNIDPTTDGTVRTDESDLIAEGTPKRPGAIRALIAIEDSEESWDAVEFAARLLKPDDETMVVNVASVQQPLWIAAGGLMAYPRLYPGYSYAYPAPAGTSPAVPAVEPGEGRKDPLVPDTEAEGQQMVEEAGDKLGAVATGVVHGDPVDRIVRIAEESEIDLIVVGTADPGLLSRIFSGPSVSRDIVDKAPCSVLVVR